MKLGGAKSRLDRDKGREEFVAIAGTGIYIAARNQYLPAPSWQGSESRLAMCSARNGCLVLGIKSVAKTALSMARRIRDRRAGVDAASFTRTLKGAGLIRKVPACKQWVITYKVWAETQGLMRER